MRRILITIICSALAYMSFGQQAGVYRKIALFEAGKEGYFTYRIPSMVTTKKGSILAFCAARKGKGGDWDPIDIVMRRSSDGGKTFDPQQIISGGDSVPCDNATPIVDYQTGQVHLVYQSDYKHVYCSTSDDDGKTFKNRIEITEALEGFKKTYPWVVAAPGPGHGIQLKSGRLVVAFWLSDGSAKEFGPNFRGHRPSIVVPVYSDDHGKNWKVGEVACWHNETYLAPSETSLIELADGRVMFNMRNESANYRRLISYSKDGATGWSTPFYSNNFFEPICFASMVRYSMAPKAKNRILFCNPDSRNDSFKDGNGYFPGGAGFRKRKNLTLRMSYDEGETYPVSKVLDPEIAGYSDLSVTSDGLIHCLYEGGAINGTHTLNTSISLMSFDLNWLTDGKDK